MKKFMRRIIYQDNNELDLVDFRAVFDMYIAEKVGVKKSDESKYKLYADYIREFESVIRGISDGTVLPNTKILDDMNIVVIKNRRWLQWVDPDTEKQTRKLK